MQAVVYPLRSFSWNKKDRTDSALQFQMAMIVVKSKIVRKRRNKIQRIYFVPSANTLSMVLVVFTITLNNMVKLSTLVCRWIVFSRKKRNSHSHSKKKTALNFSLKRRDTIFQSTARKPNFVDQKSVLTRFVCINMLITTFILKNADRKDKANEAFAIQKLHQ